ncbi:uncharacterized protein PGRI_080130 [Penicillium griseofulvum]|uniref:Uncharacterized protein n=1 Tax=Penicillium patulum TaxID=5078 RepID=A0A135LUW4_PENPA|nr:uncharacterized protein PGRI_080130 [Penicillium griseofulvum]KXG52757.1 hypothetical protein PGRI_080130 [Penicillium griseofulvum]
MPSFMDLPMEIRAMILEKVINGHRTPPISPSTSNMTDVEDMKYRATIISLRPYHEQRDTHSPSNSLPLLLTSRQVSMETQSILNRMKITYVLDISVLDDQFLFSTWISVPRLTIRLSTLHVNVRLFGRILTAEEGDRQMGCGGRQGFHWCFYALLERFLAYGPVSPRKPHIDNYRISSYECRDISVENLVLNFQSAETELPYPPDDIMDYNGWCGKHSGSFRKNPGIDEALSYKTRPEWLLWYLRSWLKQITTAYRGASYGKQIHERIGTITMLVDGRLDTTIDLADTLAKLYLTGAPSESELEWKKKTILRREARGFPVVRPSDPERE